MVLRAALFLFCLIGSMAEGQILRDLNFNYLYNSNEAFSFQWQIIRQAEGFEVYYQFQVTDSTQQSQYTIQWELRNSTSEKNGVPLPVTAQVLEGQSGKQTAAFHFTTPDVSQKLVVAKIVHIAKKEMTLFYKNLPLKPSQYVMNNSGNRPPFVSKNQTVTLAGFDSLKSIILSYYNDPFPSASPPFSTSLTKVPKTIKPDSIFTVSPNRKLALTKRGLYLAQQDTSSAEGFAFRVEEDYPKLGKLESLGGPLVYICTKQEYEKIKLAGADKKKFDQVILGITGNAERARTFMRSYYKRVEQANILFTSYKEGWKTDRGMIYIIFGSPAEVFLFDDREVWEYKIDNSKIRFQFVKSPSVFDPENFVLVREKKFTDSYYEQVDLWRKARF